MVSCSSVMTSNIRFPLILCSSSSSILSLFSLHFLFPLFLLPFLSFFFLCISYCKRSGSSCNGSYRLVSVRNVWFRPTLINTTTMVGGNEKSIDIKLESSYQISMDWFRCDMWWIRPNYLMLQIMKIFVFYVPKSGYITGKPNHSYKETGNIYVYRIIFHDTMLIKLANCIK